MAIQQISVFLENRAGQLAEITAVLAAEHIDMRAIHIAETSDYGVLRIIVDQPQRAATVLLEHGFVLSMTPVLAKEQMDVEYMYSVFGQVSSRACMIFRVGDIEKLSAILTAAGMAPASGAELGIQS